jgi:RimJ/RimL family protein N-acetyltransferase
MWRNRTLNGPDSSADDDSQTQVLTIVGERVALGPLRADLVPLYQRWRNDFFVQRTFGNVPAPVSLEAQTAWHARAATSSDYWFTIYAREGLRPIGTTDLFEVDFRFRTARFGMQIGEGDARGRGLGTEVTRLMLDFAFTALGLQNVMLDVAEYNLAGRRAYEKAGFREIGRRRQADVLAGQVWDLVLMDCVASEFTSPLLASVFAPDEPRTQPPS